MKAYMTMKCADMVEGRGPMLPDKFFLNKEDAAQYIDNKGDGWGKYPKYSENPGMRRIEEIEIYTSNVEAYEAEKAFIKEKALAKLTAEELEVLGLSAK